MTDFAWLVRAFTLVLAVPALLVSASWAQPGPSDKYGTRKPACGCYVCGKLIAVTFGNQDCAGILAQDACGQHMAGLPNAERQDFCQKIKAQLKFNTFKDACPAFAPYCGPEQTPVPGPSSGGPAQAPPGPDGDGLADGFGGPPPAPPGTPPGGLSPPRLVYLVPAAPRGGRPATAFTVYLDRAACLLPLAPDDRPVDPAAAKHVVRGTIVRGDGRVRVEAEAGEPTGAARRGPFVGEAPGADAAAVSAATRSMLARMNLACRR